MSEADWFCCDDPARMLRWLTGHGTGEDGFGHDPQALGLDPPSDRKLRLFVCAVCHSVWKELSESAREAVGILERVADDELTAAARAHWSQLRDGWDSYRLAEDVVSRYWGPEGSPLRRQQATLLRGLFGNPLRPVAPPQGKRCGCYSGFEVNDRSNRHYRSEHSGVRPCHECHGSGWTDPPAAWLTPTSRALARATYDDRDPVTGHLHPTRLAILADALEQHGCIDVYLLRRLRGWDPCGWCLLGSHGSEQACGGRGYGKHPLGLHGWLRAGPSFRGDWAVDTVLSLR